MREEGDLVRIIDQDGDDIGVAMFIDTFKPVDRGVNLIEINSRYVLHSRMFDMKGNAITHWHHEVLFEGELKWLHTDCFTLIPAL